MRARARFTVGRHAPSCSGCPACSDEAAAVLAMTSTEMAARNAAEICRHEIMRGSEFCLRAADRAAYVPVARAANLRPATSSEEIAYLQNGTADVYNLRGLEAARQRRRPLLYLPDGSPNIYRLTAGGAR